MTYSKDSSKHEISIRPWKWNMNNAVRACVYISLALSFGFAIVTISMASSRIETTKSPNFYTDLQLESRMMQLAEPKDACTIQNCTIKCLGSKKIYDEVFRVLKATDCEDNIILKLSNQRFPNSILTNRWKPANKMIKSIVIQNSEFTHIRNEAFNSFDFTSTETVTLLGVKLNTLSNGVLLGFARLQSLRLEGRVRRVDRCFFQPVQASLVRFQLRAGLTISGRDNIFGISYMAKMNTLDLSDNFITGTLCRSFFQALPHLKYLILSNSEISSIEVDAFDDIASGVLVLDLSNNRLRTLDVRSIVKVLIPGIVNIYLLGNEWACECRLKPLIQLYEQHEDRFGDVPYCKSPLAFYGVLLTSVKFDADCKARHETEGAFVDPPLYQIKTDSITAISSSTEASIPNPSISFKMACLSMIGLGDGQQSSSDDDPVEYFLFSPPCHDFELILLQNNSVQVVVQYADEPINIIWFSEALESFVHTVNGITIDYNCEMYSDPFLLAENLVENCTYTFCLVPSGTFSITPFNCLPLHVPLKGKPGPNIWISHDEKELTLGIVCLILMCSLLFGGVVAFFGIKAYPDILEGSNHVLVVKKSNKAACYVSTITDREYAISLKKKSSSATHLSSPPSSLPVTLYRDDIEEIKEESSQEAEDYYEMPYIYNKPHNCQQKCLFNKCAITPSSPPPLPKRNSDSTLYGSASELVSDVPNPKLSL